MARERVDLCPPTRVTDQCARQRNRQLPGYGASRNRSADRGGRGARPAQFWGKESVGTQQRQGKHEKKWRRPNSGRHEGGSAASRVRRLLPLITGQPQRSDSQYSLCNCCFLFQDNKSFCALPFTLILRRYVADITYGSISTLIW